jgi:hypothetical protein
MNQRKQCAKNGRLRRFRVLQAEFPVPSKIFPVLQNIFPVNFRRELRKKWLRRSGFFAMKSSLEGPKLQNSLLISLLAGNSGWRPVRI